MSIADKLTTIAANEQKVYDAGKNALLDYFWEIYQEGGDKYEYSSNFVSFPMDAFRPKYDIKNRSGTGIISFRRFGYSEKNRALNLTERLKECGVQLITEGLTTYLQAFQDARISHIPTLDFRKANSTSYCFNEGGNVTLIEIEKLIVSENTPFSHTFDGCKLLEKITIEGTIGRSIEFPHSPLTVDSCKSIINALKNYAGTTNELKYKLTLKNTVWEALNSAETPPSGNTWQDYVQSLGWLYA